MDYDFAVIGSGVVGLAVAELLSRRHYSVIVIEKEPRYGTGISSRNSEVIHAGIYYPAGSLKSRLCIKGKYMLYDWCKKNDVPHQRIGKYIVATDDLELARLEEIKARAADAGMNELDFLSAAEVRRNEPAIAVCGALHSPTTGIISAHGLMDSLKVHAGENGADFVFNSIVKTCRKNSSNSGYELEIGDSRGETAQIEVTGIVNAAGLNSQKVASVLGADDEGYRMSFTKGNYFRLRGHNGIFRRLIYPVPMPKLHGLGVHITVDLAGSVRFGPDVEPLQDGQENYDVDESRRMDFYTAVRKYFPAVSPEDLLPDMAGIRPRLSANKDFNDFIINEESPRGLQKVINCIGIESPGLTASLAIAEYVGSLL